MSLRKPQFNLLWLEILYWNITINYPRVSNLSYAFRVSFKCEYRVWNLWKIRPVGRLVETRPFRNEMAHVRQVAVRELTRNACEMKKYHSKK